MGYEGSVFVRAHAWKDYTTYMYRVTHTSTHVHTLTSDRGGSDG